MSIDSIKEKLKKLLAHQKSAEEIGNEAEAATFASKITAMLLNYELEMSDLDQQVSHSIAVAEEIINCDELTVRNEGKWVQYLYDGIARSNSCKVLLVRNHLMSLGVKLIGHDLNREAVNYIINQLVPKLRHCARYSFRSYTGFEKRNTFIRGFLMGACQTISERMWDEFSKIQYNNARMTDLVLDKNRALDEYMATKYPRLKSARSSSYSGHAGAAEGRQTGKTIGIHKNVGPGGTRLLN